jgi:hypothetical protein
MLGLLSPIWLAGLGALAVPVALHLWSRRGGRPIRVGSIRLLTGFPPATRRRWTIQDLWLLVLRCAVLAALVLALAGPYWSPATQGTRTVALVATDLADRNALIDSLRQAGRTVAPLDSDATTSNLWAALRRADRAQAPGTQFVVFAPALLRYFRGERPTLRARVDWRARPVGPVRGGLPPPPTARLVTIFADPSRRDDARYVSAALGAVGAATGIPAIVSLHPTTVNAVAARADWIVWLSNQAVPEPLRRSVQRGAVLLSDAGGAAAQRHTARVVAGPQPTDAWLLQRTTDLDPGALVWADGTGAPLLTVQRDGRGRHYRFRSRFSPAWTDLVLRPAFPLALARLWTAIDSAPATADDRRITVGQLAPAYDSAQSHGARSGPRRSLFLPTWALAVLLFFAERWWSPRRRGSIA